MTPQMEMGPRLVVARARARRGVENAIDELTACLRRGEKADDTAHIISTRLALVEHAWLADDTEAAERPTF